jgi:hypothetical protein
MFQNMEGGILRTHHADLRSFQDAAAEGCNFCVSLLQYALKETGSLEDCHAAPYPYWFQANEGWTALAFTMLMRNQGEAIRRVRDFVIIPQLQLPVKTRARNKEPAIPLWDATEVSQKWMSQCLDQHTQCQQHTQPQSYPTRLLELGDSSARLI